MWYLVKERNNTRTYRFKILEDKKFMTMELWIERIRTSTPFIHFFVDSLCSIGMDSYYWEVRPVTRATLSEVFECVLIESPSLHKVKAKPTAFQEFLNNDPVVSFPNLSGDAQLVVPCTWLPEENYGHLGSFLRKAEDEQLIPFWKRVSEEYRAQIGEETRWLSTAGLGVPWLHVRIDSRPKYYKYEVYKSEAYLDVSKIFEFIRRGNMEGINKIQKIHGLDAVKSNMEYDSPANIHTAASYGQLEVVRYLLSPDLNEDPNIKRMNDFTPLHAAAMEGHWEVVKFLLESGADPNAQTRGQKYTPMHSAAFAGHLETVRVLLKHGADPKLLNHRDEKPVETAMRTDQNHVVSYINMITNHDN